jgi:FkbM family methyltransferase
MMARRLDGRRPVHAFEISPSTFRTLASNLSGLSGCVLNNIGLSDHEGELNLQYYPSSPDRSSLIVQDDGFTKEIQPVRVTTGDAYIQTHNIDRIAFLKIDVEGHEMSVFSGLRHALDTNKIVAIQFEHGPAHVLVNHSLGDFVTFLSERQYEMFRIFPKKLEPFVYNYRDMYGPTNFLAIRKGAAKKSSIKIRD